MQQLSTSRLRLPDAVSDGVAIGKRLTGEDLTPIVLSLGYPTNDCYWFRPFEAITTHINGSRKFVVNLP